MHPKVQPGAMTVSADVAGAVEQANMAQCTRAATARMQKNVKESRKFVWSSKARIQQKVKQMALKK